MAAGIESGEDSPLSTTGNIIGILTFALGVFSFCAAFFAITHDALREIMDMQAALEERGSHIYELECYFEALDIAADAELEIEAPRIKPLVRDALDSLKAGREDMERELTAIKARRTGCRLQWWYRRQDMTTRLARIETQLQHLGAVQLTLILLKIRRQSTQLDELERLVCQVLKKM